MDCSSRYSLTLPFLTCPLAAPLVRPLVLPVWTVGDTVWEPGIFWFGGTWKERVKDMGRPREEWGESQGWAVNWESGTPNGVCGGMCWWTRGRVEATLVHVFYGNKKSLIVFWGGWDCKLVRMSECQQLPQMFVSDCHGSWQKLPPCCLNFLPLILHIL